MTIPEKFEEGVDSFRKKLNEIIECLKELENRIKEIEGMPVQSVCVHDSTNENIIRINARLLKTELLGPIECCCYSGESFGGL